MKKIKGIDISKEALTYLQTYAGLKNLTLSDAIYKLSLSALKKLTRK